MDVSAVVLLLLIITMVVTTAVVVRVVGVVVMVMTAGLWSTAMALAGGGRRGLAGGPRLGGMAIDNGRESWYNGTYVRSLFANKI